jgi:hypothetical protein
MQGLPHSREKDSADGWFPAQSREGRFDQPDTSDCDVAHNQISLPLATLGLDSACDPFALRAQPSQAAFLEVG